jgi:proteasome lid subunit RPN8/RPN11
VIRLKVKELVDGFCNFPSNSEAEICFDDEKVELTEVLIPVKILVKVLNHVISFEVKNKGLESAGILTGLRLGEVIVVMGAYPAKKIKASHSGFTIPEEELIRIDKERIEENQPGFVGLYHHHPGFGVFLSSRDIEATERFCRFYGESINLVISTSGGRLEYDFFTVQGGRAKKLNYRYLVGRCDV